MSKKRHIIKTGNNRRYTIKPRDSTSSNFSFSKDKNSSPHEVKYTNPRAIGSDVRQSVDIIREVTEETTEAKKKELGEKIPENVKSMLASVQTAPESK